MSEYNRRGFFGPGSASNMASRAVPAFTQNPHQTTEAREHCVAGIANAVTLVANYGNQVAEGNIPSIASEKRAAVAQDVAKCADFLSKIQAVAREFKVAESKAPQNRR